MYNEIVVSQESQITPVFIIQRDPENLRTKAAEWARTVSAR